MNTRKLVSLLIAALMILSFFAILPKAFAPPGPTACYYFWSDDVGSWNPATNRFEIIYPASPSPIGETFTVEWRIANITNIKTIGGTFEWNDTAVIDPTDTTFPSADNYWGDFMDPSVLKFAPTWSVGKWAGLGWTDTGGSRTLSGSAYGLIATFTFEVVGPGEALMYFNGASETDMIDEGGNHPAFNEFDLYVKVGKPAPTPPTACYGFAPPLPVEGNTVTFDASCSTDGFDGTTGCPITEYRWDWENDGTPDDVTASDHIDHIFTTAGIYTVNLTVYAPAGPTPDPSYTEYDSVTHDVTVISPPTGRNIDVTTQDGRSPDYTTPYIGFGPDMPADAFAPQDEVCLYAEVTYNNWPVQNKPVTFAVYGPYNIYQNITVERTVFTDENGTAMMCFRIPWPCENAEEIVFGTWNVIAKVDIAEITVNDTLTFEVGWIIELKPGSLVFEKGGVPTTTFQHCNHVGFDFEVSNIGMIDRLVYFTIVVYDELGVPFCEITWYKTIHPGSGYMYVVDCHIPKWAYAGTATAYVNGYTNDPWLCGTAYCPEVSGQFIIEAA